MTFHHFILSALVFCASRGFGWTIIADGTLGWETRELTFHVNPAHCPVAEATLYDILDRAISSWNGVSSASITLSRDTTASATTVAEFLAGTAVDAPLFLCDPNFESSNGVDADFIPAATRLSASGGHVSYAAILLNAESGADANISSLSEDQLAITLSHEIGHVLGLGHSGTKEALMYYSLSDKVNALLTQDDTDGLSYLYPRNEFQANPFGCASVKRSGSSAVPTGLLVFPVWLFLSLFLGRRLWLRGARLQISGEPIRSDGE